MTRRDLVEIGVVLIIFAISQFIGLLVIFDFLGLVVVGFLLSLVIGGVTGILGFLLIIVGASSSDVRPAALQYQPPTYAPPPAQNLVYCSNCGHQIPSASKFCQNCGKPNILSK